MFDIDLKESANEGKLDLVVKFNGTIIYERADATLDDLNEFKKYLQEAMTDLRWCFSQLAGTPPMPSPRDESVIAKSGSDDEVNDEYRAGMRP